VWVLWAAIPGDGVVWGRAGNSRLSIVQGLLWKFPRDIIPGGLGVVPGGRPNRFAAPAVARLQRPGGRLLNVTARFVRGKWDAKDRALCGRDCFPSYLPGAERVGRGIAGRRMAFT
jgi:hypothetical protein